MKKFSLITTTPTRYFLFYATCILFTWIDSVYGVHIPDVYWHPKNPMFNETLCDIKSKTIFARENDLLSIICPNRDLNNALVTSYENNFNHFYNIYVTDDYDLYSKRKLKNGYAQAKLLHTCKEELTGNSFGFFKATVNKQDVRLSPFGVGSSGVKFESGKTYYFYTTADGTEKSLDNQIAPNATRHLQFKIKICGQYEECPYRWNHCLQKIVKKEKRVEQDGGVNDGKEVQWSDPTLLCTIFLALVIGLFIGIVFNHFYISRRKRQGQQQNDILTIECGESLTSSSAQSSPTTELTTLFDSNKKTVPASV